MTIECSDCGREFDTERGVKVHKGRSHNQKYQNEGWLRQKYVNKQKTTMEIAESVGTDVMTIQYWLDKHGIETRSRGSGDNSLEIKPSKGKLSQLYLDQEKSTVEIANKYNVAPGTISNWLESYDIDVRSRAESLEIHIPPEDELRELHFRQKLKLWEIADYYDASRSAVSNWFIKYGIETRTYKGEEAPRWAGGHVKYYGPNWPEQRQERLEYDNHQCVVCGMGQSTHQEKFSQELHAHHIHKLRKFRLDNGEVDFERANRLENLVTLCAEHHKEWEDIPLRPQQ